jgi:hypothetical protein
MVLIPQPSVTHAFNENPGYIPLNFAQTAGGLTVTAPANGNLAPPGNYMLFALSSNGVPSVASWVRITPAGQSATVAVQVAATSTASDLGSPRPGLDAAALFATTTTSSVSQVEATTVTATPVTSGEGAGRARYARQIVCTLNVAQNGSAGSSTRGPP